MAKALKAGGEVDSWCTKCRLFLNHRIIAMLGAGPDWTDLMMFLPDELSLTTAQRKGALASTLIAGLELAKGGAAQLRQEALFAQIMIGAVPSAEGTETDE